MLYALNREDRVEGRVRKRQRLLEVSLTEDCTGAVRSRGIEVDADHLESGPGQRARQGAAPQGASRRRAPLLNRNEGTTRSTAR